jgi:hypothetical protein
MVGKKIKFNIILGIFFREKIMLGILMIFDIP